MPPAKQHHECLKHAGIETEIKEHSRRLDAHDEMFEKLFDKFERVINRPGWFVTIIISLLTTITGIAVTYGLIK